jgi:hypothetical protein
MHCFTSQLDSDDWIRPKFIDDLLCTSSIFIYLPIVSIVKTNDFLYINIKSRTNMFSIRYHFDTSEIHSVSRLFSSIEWMSSHGIWKSWDSYGNRKMRDFLIIRKCRVWMEDSNDYFDLKLTPPHPNVGIWK